MYTSPNYLGSLSDTLSDLTSQGVDDFEASIVDDGTTSGGGGGGGDVSSGGGFDLSTVLGQQQALEAVGFDPGPLDGVRGPRTIAATKAYQSARGLSVDGIFGPRTAAAMRADLANPGAVPSAPIIDVAPLPSLPISDDGGGAAPAVLVDSGGGGVDGKTLAIAAAVAVGVVGVGVGVYAYTRRRQRRTRSRGRRG